MFKKTKGYELMKIIFFIDLGIFVSNMFFTLKIMDFENVALTRVVHVYVIKNMNV
jgi:hypothetical protein